MYGGTKFIRIVLPSQQFETMMIKRVSDHIM